ncbi:MAG: alpha/beta hydrolase fold domain-containing protein, partial [Pseudomonadota bacterium]
MGPAEAYPARDGRSWHLVSPDLRDVLEAWEPLGFSDENLAALRDTPADPLQPPPAPAVSERVIPGPADHPELAVVLVDPDPRRRDKPALLHIHGGGYVLGTALSSAPRLQTLAAEVGCLIVSVEYRLAPETRHPGALEDNYAALKWLMESADELGIDPGRIAVGGESAGGGHAAMLALAARDRAGPKIAFQWLIYPMLDDRTGSTRAVSPWQG